MLGSLPEGDYPARPRIRPNPAMNKPTLSAFPAALFLAGLGLTMNYGYALWKMPAYSETDVEQSVELNLAMDLRRLPPSSALAVSELDRRRATLREEIRTEIRRERREAMQALAGGLGALVLSVGQFVWLRHGASKPRR